MFPPQFANNADKTSIRKTIDVKEHFKMFFYKSLKNMFLMFFF